MRLISPFDDLPTEIITKIFDFVVCNDEPRVDSYWSGRSLLSLVHTSSHWRSLALNHRQLWQPLVNEVLATAPLRKHSNTVNLLRFCAQNSRYTLSRLDFVGLPFWHSTWAHRMFDFLNIANSSLASLRYLCLRRVGRSFFLNCDCQTCRPDIQHQKYQLYGERTLGISRTAIEDLWARILELLCDAALLERLELDLFCHLPPADRWPQPDMVRARPHTLHLRVWRYQLLPRDMPVFLGALACQVRHLKVFVAERSGDAPEGPLLSERMSIPAAVIVQRLSANIKTLKIVGFLELKSFPALLRSEFPLLEKLCITYRDQEGHHLNYDPRPTHVGSMPSLKVLEMPAALVGLFDAPDLRCAVLRITCDRTASRAAILSRLQQWTQLQDLVLHSRMEDTEYVSQVFHVILDSLMPSSSEDVLLCPALRLLGITTENVSPDEFVAKRVFGDPAKLDLTNFIVDRGPSHEHPPVVIHTDLSRLERVRREYLSQGYSMGHPRSLKGIRILGCMVDHGAWQELLETSQCEDLWCYPVPMKPLQGPEPLQEPEEGTGHRRREAKAGFRFSFLSSIKRALGRWSKT